MDFVRGLVVRAIAGRDKGGFFVVLEAGGDFAVICNGGRRCLPRPKRKKLLHLPDQEQSWTKVQWKLTVQSEKLSSFAPAGQKTVFR